MLSCPFCKSKNLKIIKAKTNSPLMMTYHYVECEKCYARGPIQNIEEEAEEAWNDTFIRE